jgi:hypothetical protein
MSPTPNTSNSSPTASASQPATATSVTKVFDSEAMQKSVREILTEEYLVEDLRGVTCPSGKRVEVGSTLDCTVQIGDDPKTVSITVTSEKGDYEVGMPA